MNNKLVDIDTAAADAILNKLSGTEAHSIIWDGVKAGANTLKYGAQDRFRRVTPAATHRGENGKPLYEGVQSKYYPDYLEAIVHVFGDYKLRWFELGTEDRYTGKRNVGGGKRRKIYKRRSERKNVVRYTGRMTAKHFFAPDEHTNEVTDAMTEAIIKRIEEIQ